MPKRGHNTDGGQRNETGSVMPIYWRLTESLLPSVPVAVFNKCTLHRESETKLLIMGSTMEIPSITIDIEDGLGTIVSAWMQDDPDVPALIVIVFEFKVLVASPITGEIVYNKENPEATCAVIVDECICFATATCVIVDHLALEVEPVVYNYENPLISILGDSLIICHSNYDGTFSLERIPVGSVEVIETKIYTGPTDLGMPIALNSSTINKDAFLIRILCSKGLLVLSSHNILKIKGNYCDVSFYKCLIIHRHNITTIV